eukprot:gene12974-biopygen16985
MVCDTRGFLRKVLASGDREKSKVRSICPPDVKQNCATQGIQTITVDDVKSAGSFREDPPDAQAAGEDAAADPQVVGERGRQGGRTFLPHKGRS